MEFNIKRGDTSPAIRFGLLPSDLTLTGASVRFQMRPIGGQTVIDEPASIVTPSPPVVQYDWQSGDTDITGSYQAEFRVEYSDGAIETFPNLRFITVNVNDDVLGV